MTCQTRTSADHKKAMGRRISEEPQKLIVIQTPMGIVKIPLGATADMPEPMVRAMKIFESAIEKGVLDPVGETLQRLQQMADVGDGGPLAASMEFINNLMRQQEQAQDTSKREDVLSRVEQPENLN